METTQLPAGTPTRHRGRLALVGLQALIGASAVYGGVGLIGNGLGMPSDWLEGTPFDSWLVPGIFLLTVIAVPMFAAATMEILRSRWAYLASLAASGAQLGWILAQLAILQRFSFLQPVLFVAGLLAGALAMWTHRGDRLRPY